MPSGLEQCKICTKLHEGECPWANSRCRWCRQLHAEDHPIWGHCTRVKQYFRGFQTEDGRVVESVPFSNRGKGIPSLKQPQANVKPRLVKLGRDELRGEVELKSIPYPLRTLNHIQINKQGYPCQHLKMTYHAQQKTVRRVKH